MQFLRRRINCDGCKYLILLTSESCRPDSKTFCFALKWHPRLIPVELPEARGRRYFKQLLSAMHFLHKNGVTHNDIKPSNILLSDDDRPKLCDVCIFSVLSNLYTTHQRSTVQFGFAKKYDTSPEATVEAKEQPLKAPPFHSTCSYGTPGMRAVDPFVTIFRS